MKIVKNCLLYAAVLVIVVLICSVFTKTFAFNNKGKTEEVLEVTDEMARDLFEYLPSINDYGLSGLRSSYFTTAQNLYNKIAGVMTYNYIFNNENNFLEELTVDELKNAGGYGIPIHKVRRDIFLEKVNYILGDKAKFVPENFEISSEKSILVNDEYLYVYKKNDSKEPENWVYNEMINYTVTDNGKMIKIQEYYLECSKVDGRCYNSDTRSNLNPMITYSENLDIKQYKTNLKKFEHVFKYENGRYYWYSSQGV